jgi:hypothetical protein
MIPAPCHQVGGMKNSSQLANNFDYCSAELRRLAFGFWAAQFFSELPG